jgi:ribosomal protein S18 acetylase RimI-like enzyme
MRIKLIEPEDFEQLAVFFENNNVESITLFFTPFALTRETAYEIVSEDHRDRYYLGIVEGKAIGFSMLRGWDEGYAIPSFGMFIDQHQHGHGYGKQLLDLTIEAARQLGCQKVRLSVRKANHPAYRIYKSRGFKEIDRSKIDGIEGEKIIMIKDLD